LKDEKKYNADYAYWNGEESCKEHHRDIRFWIYPHVCSLKIVFKLENVLEKCRSYFPEKTER
jgi:hypothetical protein